MKNILLLSIVLLFHIQFLNAQLIDPDRIDFDYIVARVGRDTLKVPHGKIWRTQENRNITIALSNRTLNPKTKCGQAFKADTKVLYGIHIKEPYEEEKYKGIIFTDYKEQPYKGRGVIRFKPSSFVNKEFNHALLNVMVPRMLGLPEIEFKAGTEIWVDSCLSGMEFYETNMYFDEIPIYDSLINLKRIAWEEEQAELERLRILRHEAELNSKIDRKYNFAMEEVDVEPKYNLPPKMLAEFYKNIYEHNVSIEFVITEDGTLELVSSDPKKISRSMLNKYLRFEPGKVMIQNEPVNVRTKIILSFVPENIKTKDNTVREIKVRRAKKDPIARIKKYPDIYPEKELKKLVNFNKLLKKNKKGVYFASVWYNTLTLTVKYEADVEKKILFEDKIEKFKYKYKSRETDWMH